MRIIVRFKSGFELPITCDSFSITQDIECIFRDMTAEGSEDE